MNDEFEAIRKTMEDYVTHTDMVLTNELIEQRAPKE